MYGLCTPYHLQTAPGLLSTQKSSGDGAKKSSSRPAVPFSGPAIGSTDSQRRSARSRSYWFAILIALGSSRSTIDSQMPVCHQHGSSRSMNHPSAAEYHHIKPLDAHRGCIGLPWRLHAFAPTGHDNTFPVRARCLSRISIQEPFSGRTRKPTTRQALWQRIAPSLLRMRAS
ncbi:uncharacterized protein BO80DRAFT_16057 [Aspergillus ibericus CBS 121593]|uniref:Uncharacterized protein n=1 Tax=Aspergillus ibericus CBS 121593 TaxID=1448316 RepID=A0A395H6H9_9EURO|nr:hypothetical protein BO80DRAFT_16057 [Aspergillus ibericus CBS 121593]RAL03250.1 hypothetical protein BO80DRAFT_16057 [Aspergillus ibericus CBS 121593]